MTVTVRLNGGPERADRLTPVEYRSGHEQPHDPQARHEANDRHSRYLCDADRQQIEPWRGRSTTASR